MSATMPGSGPKKPLVSEKDLERAGEVAAAFWPNLKRAVAWYRGLMISYGHLGLGVMITVSGWAMQDTVKAALTAKGNAEWVLWGVVAFLVFHSIWWLVATGQHARTVANLIEDNRLLRADNEVYAETTEDLVGRLQSHADGYARSYADQLGLGTSGRVSLLQPRPDGGFDIVCEWSDMTGFRNRETVCSTVKMIAHHAHQQGHIELQLDSSANDRTYLKALADKVGGHPRDYGTPPKPRYGEVVATRIEDHHREVRGILMVETESANSVIGHALTPTSTDTVPKWCLTVLDADRKRTARATEAARGFEEGLLGA